MYSDLELEAVAKVVSDEVSSGCILSATVYWSLIAC